MSFDRGGNPAFVSHNTCHEGRCRNFGSLLFPMMCTDTPAAHGCHLDPEATCVSTAADMGMVPQMGLGAFGGLAAICVHGCTAKSDCDPVAQLLHVPMTCGTIGPVSACVPMIPFLIQCKDDGDCFGDLTCQTIPSGATSVRTCTRGCTAASDCAGDGALGSSFACVNNLCVPKTDSGEQAALPEACLSGRAVNGKCVSPTGWACNDNTQCANGQCLIIRNTDPPFGRCN
jgi:hypothetical protein